MNLVIADDKRISGSQFDTVIKKYGLHISFDRLAFRMDQLFADVPLRGRRLLEIGSGAGGFSMYAAAVGAESVLAIEPEAAGSTVGASSNFANAVDELGLENINLETICFQDLEAEPASFDIMLSFNSINHLDEEACRLLLQRSENQDEYVRMFRRMHTLLSTGGDLIIADCMRYNFFRMFPFIKHPFMPNVGWEIHQQPRVWMRLMATAGFGDFRVSYRVPYVLRRFTRFCDNYLASFMTMSHFTIRARKIG